MVCARLLWLSRDGHSRHPGDRDWLPLQLSWACSWVMLALPPLPRTGVASRSTSPHRVWWGGSQFGETLILTDAACQVWPCWIHFGGRPARASQAALSKGDGKGQSWLPWRQTSRAEGGHNRWDPQHCHSWRAFLQISATLAHTQKLAKQSPSPVTQELLELLLLC